MSCKLREQGLIVYAADDHLLFVVICRKGHLGDQIIGEMGL
jgi:hypothetical protein